MPAACSSKSTIPEESAPQNELGEPITHYEVHPELPEVWVELSDSGNEWNYSQTGVEAIPSLYKETFSGISLWFQNLLPPVFSEPLFLGLRAWQMLWFVVLIFGGLFLGFLLHSVVGARIRRAIANRGHKMDDALYARVRNPVILLTVGLVLLWGISDLQLTIKPSLFLYYIAKGIISLSVVLLSMRLIDVFGRILEEKPHRPRPNG